MACKITILGAGGACFVTGFVKDICESKYLDGATLALMDINAEKLEEARGVAERYKKETGANINITATCDRKEALKDADYVILTALVMGNDKYKEGIKIGKKHGYRFGGSLHVMHDEAFYINFYQLRLMEEILKDALEICPDAYFITTSNPVQAGVTYLKRKYPEAKVVGMCPGFYCFYEFTDVMGLDRDKIEFDFAGVNHFIWLTEFKYDGKDAFPLIDKWLEEDFPEYCKVEDFNDGKGKKAIDVYKRFGIFPIGDTVTVGGGSWSWHYHSSDEVQKSYGENPEVVWEDYFSRCENQIEFRKKIVENKDMKLSDGGLPIVYDQTVSLIESMEADLKRVIVVNIMNDKEYMKNLPSDYETEIKAVIDKDGIHPIKNDGLPKPVMALLMHDRIAPVEMELAALKTGEKKYLKELIMMDPWTKNEKQAEALLDEILDLPWNKTMKEYFK